MTASGSLAIGFVQPADSVCFSLVWAHAVQLCVMMGFSAVLGGCSGSVSHSFYLALHSHLPTEND